MRTTHRTAGWAAFCSPSPRPSPLGRGRIVRRLSAIPVTEFAKPVCAKHKAGGCCSLSPRERVRVRGNDGSTAAGCRLSKGLLSKASILVGLLWCLALLSVVVIGILHTARLDL